MTEPRSITTLFDGLVVPESLRWHDGHLFFCDVHGGEVHRAELEGTKELLARMPAPSGMGWLPDGRLLVNSVEERRVFHLGTDGALDDGIDLRAATPWPANDMVVDARGRAYLGLLNVPSLEGFGLDLERLGPQPAADTPAPLVLLTPDGLVRPAADGDLALGNGMAITPDGQTLIAAETMASRLSAWTIEVDGSLSGRRVFAQLLDIPDSICLDPAGAVWAACPMGQRAIRVLDGGEITDEVAYADRHPIGCVIVGDDQATLCISSVGSLDMASAHIAKAGRIDLVELG